jgi:hypothetical protein
MSTIDERRAARLKKARKRSRSVESAAVAGVAYAVLTVTALILLTRFPELTLSDEDVTAWFDETDHKAVLVLGLNLAAVSAIAFLWFVAVIRRRLGDREDRFLGTVFFGSAIVYVVIWLVSAAILAAPAVALTILETGDVDRATATLASGFAAALVLVVAPRIQAVFVFTTSTIILRSAVLPRWLALFGYVFGVILLTVPLITQPTGVGFPVWVLVVSVTILLSRPRNDDA